MTNLNEVWAELDRQHKEVERHINAVPTGHIRNTLCDANIHLLEAMHNVQQAALWTVPNVPS